MMLTLGWTLLHFVWQGAAVACCGLLLMVALPALTFGTLKLDREGASTTVAVEADASSPLAAAATSLAAATLPGTVALDRYERVPLDGLVSPRIHGASPEYIRGLAALGCAKLTIDQLTSLRIHGASLGFLTPDELVSMRIHGRSE